MRMKSERYVPVALVLVLVGFLLSSGTANAYAIGTTSPTSASPSNISLGISFETLFAPFEAFFESLAGSIGNQPVLGGTRPIRRQCQPLALAIFRM